MTDATTCADDVNGDGATLTLPNGGCVTKANCLMGMEIDSGDCKCIAGHKWVN